MAGPSDRVSARSFLLPNILRTVARSPVCLGLAGEPLEAALSVETCQIDGPADVLDETLYEGTRDPCVSGGPLLLLLSWPPGGVLSLGHVEPLL